MSESGDGLMTVQAELRASSVTLQIVRFVMPAPVRSILRETDSYRLDLCLTPRPRNARACFARAWGPHRFEPIGDLFLVPPGQDMHVRGDSGRQVSIVCNLPREFVDRWLAQELEWTDRRLEASLDVTSPHIRNLLVRLAEEAHRPGLAGPQLAELIAGQLAIELSRFCASVEDGPVTGGLATWRLRVIDERLRDPKPPMLEELAGLCNISIRQLTRGFRTSRGCSINDYVSHSRIEGAKRLLAGEDSVKAVAFALGFASPSSFACAFRRATGITPSHFRQRLARANLRLAAQKPRGGPEATIRPTLQVETRCQPGEIHRNQDANKKRRPRSAAA